MANVYYGDGGKSTVTGNWNTVANWFSSLAAFNCCCYSAGTPLGRVPNASTDTVYLTANGNGAAIPTVSQLIINTGPTGGYAGPIKVLSAIASGVPVTWCALAAGLYSGSIDWSNIWNALSGSTAGGACARLDLTGALFTGSFVKPAINGNTTMGNISQPGVFNGVYVSGGTFAPVTPEPDPGFAFGGATYRPVDILGAGLY